MQRDFILVFGNQGCGKSVWTKAYCENQRRLLVYDPFASYRNVDFVTDSEEWISEVANARLNAFRYGRVLPDDLPLLGKAAFCAGDCSLVIEECALLFQRGAELDIWAKNLIFMGRHQRVNLVLIAQRANKIPIDIRSQASRIVTFRQTEPDDVSALSDRIGRASRDELPTLPELHCIDWNNGKINRYSVRP